MPWVSHVVGITGPRERKKDPPVTGNLLVKREWKWASVCKGGGGGGGHLKQIIEQCRAPLQNECNSWVLGDICVRMGSFVPLIGD